MALLPSFALHLMSVVKCRIFHFRSIFRLVSRTIIRKNVQSMFMLIPTSQFFNEKKRSKELQAIVNEFWKNDLLHVNILNPYDPNETEFNLTTYFPFTSTSCSTANLKQLTFKTSETINRKHFYPNKMLNLHSCFLELVTFDTPSGIEVVLLRDKNGAVKDFRGLEGYLLKTLLDYLNVRPKIVTPLELWGNIMANGSADGAMKLMMDREVNLSIGLFHQTYQYHTYFDLSTSYYATHFCFVVPPGRPYTSIEKLLRPFRTDVWYYLLALVIATALLNVISWLTKHRRLIEPISIQDFIRVCIGMDLVRLPKSKYSKILLMILVFCLLIIRTIYQSSLFNFLISAKNFPPLQSIEEMIDMEFPLYFMQAMVFMAELIPNIRPWLVMFDNKNKIPEAKSA